MSLYPFNGQDPIVADDVFIAPGAALIGGVTIGKGSSIWFNTVLRGDINRIQIGEFSNIQDNSTLHVADEHPTIIGNYVTIGHNCLVHGATLGDNVLLGMGAIIMNGVHLGNYCLVGAGTLVTMNMVVPDRSLIVGVPGKIVRTLTEEEAKDNRKWALKYNRVASQYLRQSRPSP